MNYEGDKMNYECDKIKYECNKINYECDKINYECDKMNCECDKIKSFVQLHQSLNTVCETISNNLALMQVIDYDLIILLEDVIILTIHVHSKQVLEVLSKCIVWIHRPLAQIFNKIIPCVLESTTTFLH